MDGKIKRQIARHIQLGPYAVYLDTGTLFIILAVDQNIFKLQLHNEYVLKVHTLGINPRVFSSQLKEMLRNYSSLICTHLKKPYHFWKSILWTAEIKTNLYQNDGKNKVWRRLGTAHDPKHITASVKHGGAV